MATWPTTSISQNPISVRAEALVSPAPIRLMGFLTRWKKGCNQFSVNLFVPATSSQTPIQIVVSKFELLDKRVAVRGNFVYLSVGQFPFVSRHLPLASCNDRDHVGLGHFDERQNLHRLAGGSVPGACGSVAHRTLRLVGCFARALGKAHCARRQYHYAKNTDLLYPFPHEQAPSIR